MLLDPEGKVLDFDLLQNLVGDFGVGQDRHSRDNRCNSRRRVVEFGRLKRWPLVTGMSWLSTPFSFCGAAVLVFSLGRIGRGAGIHNIARWRFGRVRRASSSPYSVRPAPARA